MVGQGVVHFSFLRAVGRVETSDEAFPVCMRANIVVARLLAENSAAPEVAN